MAEVAEATMDLSKLQDELDALNAQITKQGSTVRQLKKDGATADVIDEAVNALQALKISASSLAEKLEGSEPAFDRKAFDDLIIRKMFVVPSFEIHGGVKGLFDLGPPACGLKVRLENLAIGWDGVLRGFIAQTLFSSIPGGHD
jgi:glycyl-tRNA synthetase